MLRRARKNPAFPTWANCTSLASVLYFEGAPAGFVYAHFVGQCPGAGVSAVSWCSSSILIVETRASVLCTALCTKSVAASIIYEYLDIEIASADLTKSLPMQGPSADCGFHESGGDVSVFQSSLPPSVAQ